MNLAAWQTTEADADEYNALNWPVFEPPHIAVTERPQADTRWPVPLPGMVQRAYTPYWPPGAPRPQRLEERPVMVMEDYPSVDIHMSGSGNVTQTVRLHSQYTRQMDLSTLRTLAAQWYASLRRMSEGPLQPKDLRRMGHPYGYGDTPVISWARLRNPRAIPGYQGRYRAGARGMVTNRAVINSVTGTFRDKWRMSVTMQDGGAQLNFWNEARSERGANYPWFLAHGTVKMQAHGPWEEVARQMLPEVHAAWREGASQAARERRALVSQMGEEGVATQEAQFEAGGFR